MQNGSMYPGPQGQPGSKYFNTSVHTGGPPKPLEAMGIQDGLLLGKLEAAVAVSLQ